MQEKSRLKNNQSYILLVVLLLVGVGVSFRLFTTWQQRKVVEREMATLQKEVEDYKQANQKLEESLKELGSLASQERSAREDLDLKREGEIVLRFAPPAEPAKPAKTEENRKRWFEYLFGK